MFIESEIVELKTSTSELKEAMIDIASMLNKHNKGTLYFGVKPSGAICGQEIGFDTLNDIATMIKTAIKPMIFPTIEKISIDDKELIKVTIEGSEVPYSCFGRYYKRVFDRTEEMTPQELKHMMLNTDYTSIWENNLTEFGLDDVDKDSLLSFYQRSVSCGRLEPLRIYDEGILLSSLGLIREERLTNAGYYLFSNKKPVVLKTAIYVTDERMAFTDLKRYEDNIYNLIDKAMSHIKEHIDWKVSFSNESTSRIETPEIPIEAVREIIINSFAHANYRSITEHQIVITPSCVEIYNPGEFPMNYTPEDFAKNRIASIPRNTKILNALYRSKDVEVQGSGLRKVFRLCKDTNTRIKYRTNELGFYFVFHRPGSTLKTKFERELDDAYNEIDLKILELLRQNPQNSREVLALKTNRTIRTVQRSLEKLKAKQVIRRVGNNRKGYWDILA